jgi:hypothetical protein
LKHVYQVHPETQLNMNVEQTHTSPSPGERPR